MSTRETLRTIIEGAEQHWFMTGARSLEGRRDLVAEAVETAGFVLVSDDPATVERVAKAMARDDVIRVTGVTWPGFTFDAHWIDFLSDDDREGYRAKARAAIAALKGNSQCD